MVVVVVVVVVGSFSLLQRLARQKHVFTWDYKSGYDYYFNCFRYLLFVVELLLSFICCQRLFEMFPASVIELSHFFPKIPPMQW